METKENKEIHIFRKALVKYIELLNSQMEAFPVILRTLQAKDAVCIKKINKFLEEKKIKHEVEGDMIKFSIPPELNKQFVPLFTEHIQSDYALELTPKNIVVAFVSIYDSFLANIIDGIFRIQPGLLNTSEKEFSFVDIVKFESIEDIKEHIIEKKVETVLRESHREQLDWLSNKLKLTLTADLPVLDDFIEITERRNLFVHTNGKVSRQYLSTVPDKYQKRSDGKKIHVGDMLYATQDYVEHCYSVLFEMGVKLGQVIWRKLDEKNSLEDAESLLITIIYDLLKEGNYDMAITLSEFATKDYVKDYDKVCECVKIINKALAYYLRGDKKKCESIISAIDWSATDPKYKLAINVLRENYDEACKIMHEIGKNDEMKENYREWPLFKVFRETESFRLTFKDIYKTEFDIVEIMPSRLEDVLKEAIQINKKKEKSKKIKKAKR